MLIKKNYHWRNNLLLLTSIIFLFIISPALYEGGEPPLLSAIFFTILILSGIYAADYKSIIFRILLILGGLSIGFVWLDIITPNINIRLTQFIFITLILVFITGALITYVASSKVVNADILLSAINGYLLIGIVGALMLTVIVQNNPQALNIELTQGKGIDQLIYFSFVTLTTLGYGDVLPVSNGAKAVVMLLALSGPLYLAILIALLVGKFQAQNQKN